jgi:hypothetical protein
LRQNRLKNPFQNPDGSYAQKSIPKRKHNPNPSAQKSTKKKRSSFPGIDKEKLAQ